MISGKQRWVYNSIQNLASSSIQIDVPGSRHDLVLGGSRRLHVHKPRRHHRHGLRQAAQSVSVEKEINNGDRMSVGIISRITCVQELPMQLRPAGNLHHLRVNNCGTSEKQLSNKDKDKGPVDNLICWHVNNLAIWHAYNLASWLWGKANHCTWCLNQACMLYRADDVIIALGITALLVIFLTAFAFQVPIPWNQFSYRDKDTWNQC